MDKRLFGQGRRGILTILSLLMTLLMAFSLAGCGSKAETTETPPPVEDPPITEELPVPAEEPRAALRSQKAFVDEFNKQLEAQGVPIGEGLPYPDPALGKDSPRTMLELEANNTDTAANGEWIYTDLNIYINIDDKTGEDLITEVDLDAGWDAVREITKAAIVAYSEGMTLEEADRIVTKTKADQGFSEDRAYNVKYKGYYYSYGRGYFTIVNLPYDMASFEYYDVDGNDGREVPVETDPARDVIIAKIVPPGSETVGVSGDAYFLQNEMGWADCLQWYEKNLKAVGFVDETPEEIVEMMGDPLETGTLLMTGSIDGAIVSIGLTAPQGFTLEGKQFCEITVLFE